MPGINQVLVRSDIGLTFARILRSFLRQDPDIIMVGEIRDLETAEIAIQASLTGHLVFSTLHTNDSAGSFTRLLDMGWSRSWWGRPSRLSLLNAWCVSSAVPARRPLRPRRNS